MTETRQKRITTAIGISACVALAVNLVRFLGEREHWAPAIFNTSPGGGGSPLGITWLVLVFGFWFGRVLAQNGHRPAVSTGRALLLHVLGVLVFVGVFALAFNLDVDWRTRAFIVNPGAVAAGMLALLAWRRAYVVNLVAGLLARAPVLLIQYVSVQQGLDVHFAKGPPDSPPEDALFLVTMAQTFSWPFGFTVLVGGFFAVLGAATVRR